VSKGLIISYEKGSRSGFVTVFFEPEEGVSSFLDRAYNTMNRLGVDGHKVSVEVVFESNNRKGDAPRPESGAIL
jgi:hypothetical protein